MLRSDLEAEGVRVRLDAQVATSFGRRATDWELKGVPIRIEVGPRDLVEGLVTVARRDNGEKQQVSVSDLASLVPVLLAEIQADLLSAATNRRDARTVQAATVDEALEGAKVGFATIAWDVLKDGGEARLAQDAISVRCLQRADGGLPRSEDEPDLVAYVARSY
jgi:prolyl-tRNA synthetase